MEFTFIRMIQYSLKGSDSQFDTVRKHVVVSFSFDIIHEIVLIRSSIRFYHFKTLLETDSWDTEALCASYDK